MASIFNKQQNVTGYWGPITSSVDWCEENYAHSFYIAEFWNTVSSFAMVALGLLGIVAHHRSMGWRLSNGYLMIVVVGVGSVLFHATLQYEHQMWDEVPMVWTACYLLWVMLVENGYSASLFGVAISSYCALATYVTSQSKGSTQFFMFQTSFGLVMWSCLWFVWKLYKGVTNREVIHLFHQGAKFLLLAIGVWLFDSNMCFVYDYLPNFQLHAWWHVLMCVSLHFFFVATGYEMLRTKAHEIRYVGWFPYVYLNQEIKKAE
ncbi:alkaline phytoceramidase family protein [Hesseltinella vesiculosa]|uniref:Alkaline phytoceramidase family protein n=1 Tax=Hesseltinella vesiculosa TaxID=101127 RepID=A0A1X2GE31_9FUNG|nr:alkaline phytoceramidase family protein [Hesseltinella vesiculosa]